MAERPTDDTGEGEPSESNWPAWVRWAALAFVLLLVAGLVNAFVRMAEPPPLDRVRVGSAELIGATRQGDRWVVDRTAQPNLHYRATLVDVPPRARMQVRIEWVSPSGAVTNSSSMGMGVGRMARSSLPVDNQFNINSGSALGRWSVRLSLGGRLLDETAFEVVDPKAQGKGP